MKAELAVRSSTELACAMYHPLEVEDAVLLLALTITRGSLTVG